MSHFTVLITGDKSNFDALLAPFAERTEDCPPHCLEFEDSEAEYLEKYENGTHKEFYDSSSSSWGQVVSQSIFEKINLPIGRMATFSFTKKDMDMMHYWELNCYYHCGLAQTTHKCPTEYVWVKVVEIVHTDHPDRDCCFEGTIKIIVVDPPKEIPNKTTYGTFEEFMEDYAGYSKRDNKTNRYGYWHNPNAKWDYWRVGGRWSGFFLLKPEFRSLYESPEFSWEWKDNQSEQDRLVREGWVDSALKKHVDWDKMMDIAGEKAGIQYDFVINNILGDLPVNESWEVVRNGEGGENAREKYWAQPRCKVWQEWDRNANTRKQMEAVGISSFSGSPDDYLISRDNFIKRKRMGAISTFAVLHDGKWAERGKMGWWACVSNENDSWEDTYAAILAKIDDDTQLTVLDCHI